LNVPIQANCRWCEAVNDITDKVRGNKRLPAYCSACGHRIEGLPVDCDCRVCKETKRLIEIREREQKGKRKD